MPLLHDITQFLRVALVNLIDEQEHRYSHLLYLFEEVDVLLRILDDIGDIKQDIGISQCTLRESEHHLLHLVVWLQDARGIRKHDLHIIGIHDTHDTMTSGLRLEGSDADTLAHQLIHQRTLTHIRVTHDIYKTCFMHTIKIDFKLKKRILAYSLYYR